MPKYKLEKEAPKNERVPENIPDVPKFKCIYADPPWNRSQLGHWGAVQHYPLMSLDRIKNMPVADLADNDAFLWLWTTNAGIEDALEVIKAWGFSYRSIYHYIKPRMGLGRILRNSSESILVATRGKPEVKFKGQMNWGIYPVTKHSEKPRELISVIERICDGPYLELFCRRRPASTEKWYCWGNETEGGADFFIPGYPVPKYSFEKDNDEQEEV